MPFSRIQLIVALVALAAVGAGIAVYTRVQPSPGGVPGSPSAATPAPAPSRPVTAEEYRAGVRAAVKTFAAADATATSNLIRSLTALKVPESERKTHLELVTALGAYRDALAQSDASAEAAALVRLRALLGRESWIGLTLPPVSK